MDWLVAHWAALIGPVVVAAVISGIIAVIGLAVSTKTARSIHSDKLAFDERLAERKFQFDQELAERKFKYDRDLHDHKRRAELAETILADVYQIDDAIRAIRSPAGFQGEAASRVQNENETEEEASRRDTYFVPIARLSNHSEFISAFMSKRYRSRAVLGPQIDEAFNLVHEVIVRIRVSAMTITNMIGQGRQSGSNSALWHRCEADIWQGLADDDPLDFKVKQAIAIIENVCQPILEGRATP